MTKQLWLRKWESRVITNTDCSPCFNFHLNSFRDLTLILWNFYSKCAISEGHKLLHQMNTFVRVKFSHTLYLSGDRFLNQPKNPLPIKMTNVMNNATEEKTNTGLNPSENKYKRQNLITENA